VSNTDDIANSDRLRPWYRSTFGLTVIGGLLLWAAFPPLGWWPLAWLAPAVWTVLVRSKTLSGRRPYRAIYFGSFLHWMLLLQWVRLPHWALYFGWFVLAAYLALYLPLFVAISRVAVHRLRVPLPLAVPVVWTGLELLRAHFATGFSLAMLPHTQLDWPALVQIADLGGTYAISFVIVLCAASVVAAWRSDARSCSWKVFSWKVPIPAVCVLILTLVYGQMRLDSVEIDRPAPLGRVAIIQGTIDTVFGGVPDNDGDFFHYLEPTLKLANERTDVDLVIWPESAMAHWLYKYENPEHIRFPSAPAENEQAMRERVVGLTDLYDRRLLRAVRRDDWSPGAPLLAGGSVIEFSSDDPAIYNAALLVDVEGQIVGRYDKMHPVMFGEYIPFATWMPWLYKLTPMPNGLTPGREPQAMPLGAGILSPSICFENVVPHLIRRQIITLRDADNEPDVLVTLTNDGWFWGSSLLDLHLKCGQFRAIESRKPVLIAANTGFSASIDGSGRLLSKGPRRQKAVLIVDVFRDNRDSPYLKYGDAPAGLCLMLGIIVAGYALITRFRAVSASQDRP